MLLQDLWPCSVVLSFLISFCHSGHLLHSTPRSHIPCSHQCPVHSWPRFSKTAFTNQTVPGHKTQHALIRPAFLSKCDTNCSFLLKNHLFPGCQRVCSWFLLSLALLHLPKTFIPQISGIQPQTLYTIHTLQVTGIHLPVAVTSYTPKVP